MLIDELIKQGYLKTPIIIEAFRKINRADFLPASPVGGPEEIKDEAELNIPLPIGFGQTISQPLTVAFMMELLEPEPGDKILDIGSGSGWTTALLAHIVSQELKSKIKNQKSKIDERIDGRVVAVEVIPELKEFGEKNVAKYSFIKKSIVEFVCADGSGGYEKEAPFDKILCSAAVQKEIPRAWKEQLKIGGRIVTPVGSSIWLLIKKAPPFAKATAGKEKNFEEYEYPGFAFVPLIEEN